MGLSARGRSLSSSARRGHCSAVVVTSLESDIKLGTGKKAKKTTGIVIPFSGASSDAGQQPGRFHLLSGKVKKGHTTYSKNVR